MRGQYVGSHCSCNSRAQLTDLRTAGSDHTDITTAFGSLRCLLRKAGWCGILPWGGVGIPCGPDEPAFAAVQLSVQVDFVLQSSHTDCLLSCQLCLAAGRTAGNVPVSELGAQYVKDTQELTDAIETYITIVSDFNECTVISPDTRDVQQWRQHTVLSYRQSFASGCPA